MANERRTRTQEEIAIQERVEGVVNFDARYWNVEALITDESGKDRLIHLEYQKDEKADCTHLIWKDFDGNDLLISTDWRYDCPEDEATTKAIEMAEFAYSQWNFRIIRRI